MLRCFLYYKDGKIKTASRGGQNYDVAATHICQDPHVVEIFKKFPDIILDGELYYHHKDWNLQKISGLGRLETLDPDHKFLNFHCYDLVDETKTFKDRWKFLQSLKKDNSKLVIVQQHNVTTHEEIMELHNYYVSNGYEGAVIRDADAVYKPSSRSRIMQKIKIFQDDEFVITGITEGLRDEDFVFNLVTADGKPFEAKPTGTREERQEYRDNIDNIIGKKGTVKYFGFTPDGIPNLPVFRAVVNEKDR